MNGYTKFKPFKIDFYVEAFAKGVKGDGSALFDSVLRRHSILVSARRYTKTLEEGHAMYLYGGKKALVREFTGFQAAFGDFVLTPGQGQHLSCFHGKIKVDLDKTKRIVMITSFKTTGWPPTAIDDRRLRVNLGNQYQTREQRNYGFYNKLDLHGLEQIVRAIPA